MVKTTLHVLLTLICGNAFQQLRDSLRIQRISSQLAVGRSDVVIGQVPFRINNKEHCKGQKIFPVVRKDSFQVPEQTVLLSNLLQYVGSSCI